MTTFLEVVTKTYLVRVYTVVIVSLVTCLLLGKPVNNAEDRIFSTAMAVNTLLYTWRDGTDLSAETPLTVSTTIQQLCGWLEKNTLSGEYKPYNAFFSGSVKNTYLVSMIIGYVT